MGHEACLLNCELLNIPERIFSKSNVVPVEQRGISKPTGSLVPFIEKVLINPLNQTYRYANHHIKTYHPPRLCQRV